VCVCVCAAILFILYELEVLLESIIAHESGHKIDNLRYKRARHNEGIVVCERQIRPLIRGMKTWTRSPTTISEESQTWTTSLANTRR
jgi:abortive infection bacteriophage resistance protein